jgi:hypothetical protein
MKSIHWPELILRLLLIGVAAIAPNAFPAAQAGYGTLHAFALYLILPAAVVMVASWGALRRSRFGIAEAIRTGAIAGAFATLALEAIRYSGFKLGFMPGNLPELMGVLLLDRFALGPSAASTVAGFVYHFWNGACFGIIFALLSLRSLQGLRLQNWWESPYVSCLV